MSVSDTPKKINLTEHCAKHGGYGFTRDCFECNGRCKHGNAPFRCGHCDDEANPELAASLFSPAASDTPKKLQMFNHQHSGALLVYHKDYSLLKEQLDATVDILNQTREQLTPANAKLEEEKKLSAAISRDCNNTALERNELRAKLASTYTGDLCMCDKCQRTYRLSDSQECPYCKLSAYESVEVPEEPSPLRLMRVLGTDPHGQFDKHVCDYIDTLLRAYRAQAVQLKTLEEMYSLCHPTISTLP